MGRKRSKSKNSRTISIDLHGLRAHEAQDRIEDAMNRAVLDDITEILFIHGHGTGKLKQVLHEYLRECSVTSSFKLDELNSGITRVWLYTGGH